MEEQMVKNLKAKLKKKKEALIWGEKKTSTRPSQSKKKQSLKPPTKEDDQLESITAGLSKLKNKIKKTERISEHSSEDQIMVRIGSSKKQELNDQSKKTKVCNVRCA
jgi:hypothetical protein